MRNARKEISLQLTRRLRYNDPVQNRNRDVAAIRNEFYRLKQILWRMWKITVYTICLITIGQTLHKCYCSKRCIVQREVATQIR